MDLSGYNQEEVSAILKEKATELFRICDRSGNNYLTKDDLFELTRELGLTAEQVETAFDKLDTDGNKFLTLDEFVEGFGLFLGVHTEQEADPELLEQLERSKELFKLCDENGNGYVTEKDLLRLKPALGLSNEEISEIFYQLDEDHNGFLTLYEFSQGFSGFVNKNEPTIVENNAEKDVALNGSTNGHATEERLVYSSSKQNSIDDETGLTNVAMNTEVRDLLESVGPDLITDALTQEQLQDLWKMLRRNDAMALSKFEDFLTRVSGEMRKAKLEAAHLEHTLRRKNVTHDLEVQHLYEEMENQIKTEQLKQHSQEVKKERALKEELAQDLEEKEEQLRTLLEQQSSLEGKLQELQSVEHRLREERTNLTVENSRLEDELNSSMNSLNDSKTYISHLQAMTEDQKRDRLKAAVQASNGVKQEHESLIVQLDALRDMNKKLRDDKDAIEMSIKRNRFRQESLDEEMSKTAAQGKGKRPLTREGSNMANYFGEDKRGRHATTSYGSLSSASSQRCGSRHRSPLHRQGSVLSNYAFPPCCGSHENLDALRRVEEEAEGEFSPATSMDGHLLRREYSHDDIDGHEVFEPNAIIDHQDLTQHPLHSSTPHRHSTDIEHFDPDAISQGEGSLTGSSSIGPSEMPTRVYKIVFIGDSSVGKSSFIHRFCFDDFLPNFSATIGVDFQVKSVKVRNQWVALQLWDTAGQERFRSITKQYFRKADGVVVMFDLCSAISFTNIRAWLTSVEEGAETDCSLLLLGNKLDRADKEELRRVNSAQGEQLAKEYKCSYFETSAKSGDNVKDAMKSFAGTLSEKEDHRMQASVLNLSALPDEEAVKKKGCCGKG